MKPVEIKSNIYWVGAIDRDLRNFHGYSTSRGSSYNAYLIEGEKTVLVDTVKRPFIGQMFDRIEKITDLSKIDYIVSSHSEMDHSGSIPQLMRHCPGATLITSPNGEKALKKHYDNEWKIKVVNSGDKISLGSRTLSFLLMPMVHWPDSMATYISEEKLLLPNDAFGQHIASDERFDHQTDWGVLRSEAAKYYANIVLPYGERVSKVLAAVKDLDIDMIAPSHGVIWDKYIEEIVGLYTRWADNYVENKAVIVYDSMWKSTEKISEALNEAFLEESVKTVVLNLSVNHISDVMTEVLDAGYICVGSPTLNNGILPTVAAFLAYMKGLAPKKRKGLSFGSYGWGGQSVPLIQEMLISCGFHTMDPVKVQWVPSRRELNDIKTRLKQQISQGGNND